MLPLTLPQKLAANNIPFQIVSWDMTCFSMVNTTLTTDVILPIRTIPFMRRLKNIFGAKAFDDKLWMPCFSDELHYVSRYIHQIPIDVRFNREGFLLPAHEILNQHHMLTSLFVDPVFIKPDFALKSANYEIVNLGNIPQRIINQLKSYPAELYWIFKLQPISMNFVALSLMAKS